MKRILLFPLFVCLFILSANVFAIDSDEAIKNFEKEMAEFTESFSKLSAFDLSSLNPTQKKMLRLATDSKFQKAAMELWNHPNRKNMLLTQLCFFVFMIIFKAWRLSKMKNWFVRLGVSFLMNIFTIVVISYIIPFFMLGEPFRIFTKTLWQVFST